MEPTGVSAAIASVGKEAATAAEGLETFLREDSIAQKGEILIQQLDTIKNTPFESLKAQVDGVHASGGELPKQEVAHAQAAARVGNETGPTSEVLNRELENLGQRYNDEVRKSSSAERVEPTNVTDWKRVPVNETKVLRQEFNGNKAQSIKDWETLNGREWPRYETDVIDPRTGKTVQKAGDLLDRHHIQPLEFGGKNTVQNITPIPYLDHRDHMGIHRVDGPYHELANHLRNV